MAISQVGSVVWVDASGAVSGTDSTVDIPSGADCCVALTTWYDGGSAEGTMTSLTLDGDPMTLALNIPEDSGQNGCVIGVVIGITAPQTDIDLDWVWSDGTDRNEGGAIALVFFSGVKTSAPVYTGAAGAVATSQDNYPGPVAIDSTATDFVFGMAMCSDYVSDTENPDMAISGQTEIINNYVDFVGEHSLDIYSVDSPGSLSTDIDMVNDSANLNYSTLFGISLIAAAAGGGRIMSSLANHGGLAGRGGIAGSGGGLAG